MTAPIFPRSFGKHTVRTLVEQEEHVSLELSTHTLLRWEWNASTGTFVCSGNWAALLLAAPEDLLRENADQDFLRGRIHDEDREAFSKAFEHLAFAGKDVIDLPVRLRRFDNTWVWVLFQEERPLPKDRPEIVSGIAVDVSGLRRVPRFLPPRQEAGCSSCRDLLEHSPNFIIRYDRQLTPLYINPAMETFLGCTLKDLRAKNPAERRADKDYISFVHEQALKVFGTGQSYSMRRAVPVPAMDPMVVEFCFWPEFDEDGLTVTSVVAQVENITHEVRREEERRVNDMRFSALHQLNQMHDATEEDLMRFVVQKIAQITGSEYSHLFIPHTTLLTGGYTMWSARNNAGPRRDADRPEKEGPLLWREFNDPDDERLHYYTASVIRNSAKETPPRYFFGDRDSITRYMFVPAREGERIVCAAAVYNKDTDYTEEDLRQLELFLHGASLVLRRRGYIDALEKAKASAELANKVKDRFLANVSHELRTPLNGLLSMLQLLELSDLNEEQREYTRDAALTGNTLLRIISDILDFSRLETRNLPLSAAPFDLKETIVSTLHMFREAVEKKGLFLQHQIEKEIPALLAGDEARIRQIIFNLVGNAVKFTQAGGISLHCSLLPDRRDGRHWLYLAVRDTGIGIPGDMLGKVFDAFTQVNSESMRKYEGTGLGLGIVRYLITLMEGTITLESVPDKGTTVHCTFPMGHVESEAAPARRLIATAEGSLPLTPPMTILVAEDDHVSQVAMRLFLQRLGHTPVCVENGRQALEALQFYPFDCLISDVLMPEMDGIELTRRIRRHVWADIIPSEEVKAKIRALLPKEATGRHAVPTDLPIVTASAHAMPGDRERFLLEGMDFYLSKPVSVAELSAVLQQVYEKRREHE